MSSEPELLRLINTIEGLDEQANIIWSEAEKLHEEIEATKREVHEIIKKVKENQWPTKP